MELLVAMTLLGLLMTALFGGVRLGARVWEASDRTVQESSRAHAIRGFLRDRLEQTIPVAALLAGDRDEVVFAGERTALRFASTMPASLGTGPFVLELALTPGQDGNNDLTLRWRALGPAADAGADEVRERVIVGDVATIALSYFGGKDGRGSPDWHGTWIDQDFLPSLVRLELDFPANDSRHWPALIISPKIDEWYDVSF